MGYKALARATNLDEDEARRFKADFAAAYPAVLDYLASCQKQAVATVRPGQMFLRMKPDSIRAALAELPGHPEYGMACHASLVASQPY